MNKLLASCALPLLATFGCAANVDPPAVTLVDARADALAPGDVTAPDAPANLGCHIADATWMASSNQYLVLSKTGRAVVLDPNGGPVSDRPFGDYGGLVTVCGGATLDCQIDAVAWHSASEIFVVARGYIWSLNAQLTAAGPPQALLGIPGVAAGPCAGVTGTCHVDGLLWREDLQQFLAIARGNVYTIAADLSLVATSAVTSFSGLAQGPCAAQAGVCHVDAAMYRAPVYQVIYGNTLYNLDATTGAGNGTAPLTAFSGLHGVCP